MKRLGIRKAVTAVFNSKIGQVTDKVINAVVTTPGTIVNKTGVSKLTNKVKIDVSGKGKRKKANMSIQDKIAMANKKLVEQDARDLASAKAFEREEAEGIKEMGFSVDLNIVTTTRISEEA
jgi:hypothetical protein